MTDLELVGARGGGFGFGKGVLTEVCIEEAKTRSIRVFINGKFEPQAETSLSVVQALLNKVNREYSVVVNHKVEVPIGAGFGSSAAGALTTGLALSDALDLRLTYNQIGRIAHVADVQCKTGLGTVGALMVGGCILTLDPGAPGIGVVDRIPITDDYMIVAGVIESTPTKQVLMSAEKRSKINRCGRKTLEAIMAEPSIENFLAACLRFAEDTGFMTQRLRHLVRLAEAAGAIGVAQNMVGEAVHALTLQENAVDIEEAFKQVLPKPRVLKAKVDLQGARLIGHG
jgi:pantoate kinase